MAAEMTTRTKAMEPSVATNQAGEGPRREDDSPRETIGVAEDSMSSSTIKAARARGPTPAALAAATTMGYSRSGAMPVTSRITCVNSGETVALAFTSSLCAPRMAIWRKKRSGVFLALEERHSKENESENADDKAGERRT